MTTPTTAQANDTRLADVNKKLSALGQQSAKSALAKPQMALAIAQARVDGIIDDNAGQATYDVYMAGRRKALDGNKLGSGADEGGSTKANVSKNTQIIKAAGIPTTDFVDVMMKAVDIRDAMVNAEEKVKPTFDAFVDLARAAIKAPDQPLTEDEIQAIIAKPAAKEKELVDKLIGAYKTARKLAEAFPVQCMDEVVKNYATAIEEAGGEVPAISDDEKEAAAATAFLSKQGFTADQIAAILAAKATSNVQ